MSEYDDDLDSWSDLTLEAEGISNSMTEFLESVDSYTGRAIDRNEALRSRLATLGADLTAEEPDDDS